MSKTKDNPATPKSDKPSTMNSQTDPAPDKAPEKFALELEISNNAVARIQAVYDKFISSLDGSIPEDVLEDMKDDLQQETAVAVLEAMMSMADDDGNVLDQAGIYDVVSEYLNHWLAAQLDNDPDKYISLQDIMASMYNTGEDDYRDADDQCGRNCRNCKKTINIINADGGIVCITL